MTATGIGISGTGFLRYAIFRGVLPKSTEDSPSCAGVNRMEEIGGAGFISAKNTARSTQSFAQVFAPDARKQGEPLISQNPIPSNGSSLSLRTKDGLRGELKIPRRRPSCEKGL